MDVDFSTLSDYIIESVKCDKKEFAITFTNGKTLVMTACGGCCSRSTFHDFFTVTNMVGKSINAIETDKSDSCAYTDTSGSDDYVQITKYLLVHDGNKVASFILKNVSNGYYSGYIDCRLDNDEESSGEESSGSGEEENE